MRRDLLRADSLIQGFGIVHVREVEGISVGVIRMDIALFHFMNMLLVVPLSILLVFHLNVVRLSFSFVLLSQPSLLESISDVSSVRESSSRTR